jgi:DNA invertase Pin-like site-specific DNA recombinase/rubrerythrin
VRATRAVIYSRVSTEEQAEHGTSLQDQQERCEAYCRAESWTIADRFIDDGVSGATTERPELTRLLSLARSDSFDQVVVTDPDRLSRDLVDGLMVERELAAEGVGVVYLIQPSMGTLERQIRGVIAEEERRKIRERTSRGLRAVAAAGRWPGGPPPYGYRIERSADGHSDLVTRDEEAATITRMIDALVDRRLTTWQLAAELNTESVPTPSQGRKLSSQGSARWTHRRVRETLKTARGIAGQWTYTTTAGDFSIPIPAIVSEARLQQLQDRLSETSTGRNATAKKHAFLFARRVTSECGSPMHGYARSDSTGRAYRCSMSTADRGPDRCDCRRVSADALEVASWRLVVHELTDRDRLHRLAGIAGTRDSPQANGRTDIRALYRQIKRLENALAFEIADLLAHGVGPSVVAATAQELEQRLTTLRDERNQAVRRMAAQADRSAQVDRITRLAASAKTALENPTPELMARVIDLLDIRIAILGHTPCPTCNGNGLIPASAGPSAARRRKTGAICPTCRRHRTIPSLEIRGLLPYADDIFEVPSQDGIPFMLRLTS